MSSYPVATSPPFPRPKSWFERHWVLLLVGVVVAIALLVCGLVLGVFATLGKNDACRMAVGQKKATVAEMLGTPMKRGMFVLGNINVQSGGTGHAELSVPVSGPKGEGTLYVVADREQGIWKFASLNFTGKDGTQINLLEEGAVDPSTGTF